MAIWALMLLGILCAAAFGVVLIIVHLLSNEQVRAVIKALLAVPLVFLIALMALHASQRGRESQHREHSARRVRVMDARSGDRGCGTGMSRADLEEPRVIPAEVPAPAETAAEFKGAAPGGAGDSAGGERNRAVYARVFRALVDAMYDNSESAANAATPRADGAAAAADAEKRAGADAGEHRPLGEASPDPDRPPWVDTLPQQIAGVYRMPTAVGPYATRGECERELPKELRAAMDEYVELYLGPKAVGRVMLPLSYVQENVVREDWLETRQVAVSPTKQIPMVRLHVLLEFDRGVNARLDEAWHRAVIHRKLWALGTAGTVLLMCLSAFWGYLRIDLATAGAYRRRLRFVAGLAAVGALVAGLAFLA